MAYSDTIQRMIKFLFQINGAKENWKELRYESKEAESFWTIQRIATKNQRWISVKKEKEEKEDLHILIFASIQGL